MAPVAVTPPRLETALPPPKYRVGFDQDDTHAYDFHSEESSPLSPSPDSDTPIESLVVPSDPHRLPTFDSTTLIEPTAPVLYLPPLLSSLPVGLKHSFSTQLDRLRRPLNTETRLPDIDPMSLALHKALHHFQPVTPQYAETPYQDAFNWSSLQLPEDGEREWYCVVFRSKRREGSDGGPLYKADRKAHEEAVQNGGLIMYWYGIPHPVTSLNMATCIWQSRQHAIAANSRPHHVNAMRLAAASFEYYELNRYRLSKVKGETTLRVTPYDSGDVGW